MDGLVVKIDGIMNKRMDEAFSNTEDCDLYKDYLELPEIASNKTAKHDALFNCGLLCGDACPSETGKDRALGPIHRE